MKILIIEDELLAAERLEEMLNEIDPSFKVVARLGSIKESVEWLQENYADLIFLDIQLSDGISFTIFEKVKTRTPIIFTTAFDQYAIKAFELNSIAYILKPINKASLEEGIAKFQSLKVAYSFDVKAISELLAPREKEYKERFLIQIGQRYSKIDIKDIAYFYASDTGINLKTFSGAYYPVDLTMDKIESLIDPSLFFRINRKLLISHNSISNMTAYSRGRIKITLNPEFDSETDAIVSIDRSGDFKRWLDK
ncbi:MAG: LytTR family DNA-binding domain-containing protein [Bacteroidales bacterium]|nr:LytTR family DNA-binding domain-containing protein [Bacteroidales bacterium]MDD3273614.1 LytTR family DNA-binding domain-containing protein [Bacteroidales bacterium]